MKDYARIAARVFNTPLLATPEAACTVADVIAARLGGEAPRLDARASSSTSDPDDEAGYDVADGIATIPVRGELVNRGSWLDAMSGLTSYESIAAALDRANADYAVKAILLDIDSPGGEASGAMETAAKVRASAKPVVAYVNALAASAAYAIAAGAQEIVATPSASLGSIGVVWMHLDRSQAMKDRGLKPTLLHAGAYKIDGHSLGPMPDDARARIQGEIDQMYGLFVASVGKHRPKLGEDGARATEAGIFMGERAVAAGLADRVGDAATARTRALSRAKPFAHAKPSRSPHMANHDESLHTQASTDAAVAIARREAETASAAAVTQAATQAATQARADERARIKSILDGEAAKGKTALARHFALATDMSPESAAIALAAAAPEAAPGRRMDAAPAVDIRPGAHNVDAAAEADAIWAEIAAKQNARLPGFARRA